jgi:hypothetical protein
MTNGWTFTMGCCSRPCGMQAFDKGLVTFDDAGNPEFAPTLSEAARAELRWQQPIPLTDQHRIRLVWHREHLFQH